MADSKKGKSWTKKIFGFGKEEKKPPEPEQPPQTEEPQSAYTPNLVLVIDDSEIDRMILEDMLQQAGYDVMLAADGEEGMALFRENQPALAITDMIMPGISGTDVILNLLKEFPDAKFIAMSAGGELGPEVALAVVESINIHTVAKPFEPKEILGAVKKLIG